MQQSAVQIGKPTIQMIMIIRRLIKSDNFVCICITLNYCHLLYFKKTLIYGDCFSGAMRDDAFIC